MTQAPSRTYRIHMPQVQTITADGEAVREWRHRRGLTTPALGAKIHRSGSSIRHIEAGNRTTSLVLINQIANGLDVDVNLLIKPAEDDEPELAEAS